MKTFLPILLIFLSIATYYIYVKPWSMELKALVQKKEELNDVLLKAKDLKVKREDLQGSYDSISQENIDKLNKIIPIKFDSVLFANEISDIATKNKLKFSDYKVDETGGEDKQLSVPNNLQTPYKTTLVNFKLDGQYQDFLAFLKTIESDLRLMDIVSLSTVQLDKQEKSNSGMLQFTLLVNTYSQK